MIRKIANKIRRMLRNVGEWLVHSTWRSEDMEDDARVWALSFDTRSISIQGIPHLLVPMPHEVGRVYTIFRIPKERGKIIAVPARQIGTYTPNEPVDEGRMDAWEARGGVK